MEMIGATAIVALLASVLIPSVLRQMDQAARTKEANDLNSISNAIVLQILTTKTIPDITGLPQAIANWTRFPVSRINVNNRGFTRSFLIDTNGWFGTTAGTLPYTQTTVGSAFAPTNARVIVLGVIANRAPISSGTPGTVIFNDVWNTAAGVKPTTLAGWAGKGEDLFIQRLNLGQLFHRLTVVNRDKGALTPPGLMIDANNVVPVNLDGRGTNGYYLDGSVVGLWDTTNGTPMMRVALTRDSSFAFEGGTWLNQVLNGDSNEVMAQDFAALAAQFLASQWYPGAHQGGDQQGALVAMFDFMLVYGLWANQCPHFPWHSASSGTQVPEYELLYDIGGNSQRLSEFTGTSGLLK